MTGARFGNGPRILGVQVPAYKNLRGVWLPWSSGLALVGANGSGKTNLLEALALLLGDDATLRRAEARLDPSAGVGLSVVVADDHARMPVSDERAAYWEPEAWPGWQYAQLRADWEWLQTAQPDTSTPDWRAATVRYTLQSVSRGERGWERRFSRNLLGAGSADAAESVLELSDTSQPPAVLQWLPQLRSEDEVFRELVAAFDAALPQVSALMVRLDEALTVAATDNVEGEAHWILHEQAAAVAAEELTQTAPSVRVLSAGEGDADWMVRTAATGELGRVGDGDVLIKLSSGQRRWADEALAAMARELRDFKARAELYQDVLDNVSEELLEQVVIDNPHADLQISTEEYWSFETFTAFLQALQPALTAAATAAYPADSVSQRLVRVLKPYFDVLDSQLVVRVIDEPEAHLHPTAQRQVAAALDTLRNQGSDIVVASHSPTFVDRPGWQTVHVRDGGVNAVDRETDVVRTALARDLGITTGELFSTLDHLLVVEGEHDRLVLEELWGLELRAAGVGVVRMLGTHNILATVDLDFIERYLAVDVTVMLDNTRLERLSRSGERTPEEKKLLHLRRTAKERGRKVGEIGLDRPDIVCYLSETAVRSLHPTFTSWTDINSRRPDRPMRYKEDWLLARHGVDLTSAARVREVLDLMRAEGHRPVGELTQKVERFLAERSEVSS